jgi:hypothetical protein
VNDAQDGDLRDNHANEYDVAADGDGSDTGSEFRTRLSAFGEIAQDGDPGPGCDREIAVQRSGRRLRSS